MATSSPSTPRRASSTSSPPSPCRNGGRPGEDRPARSGRAPGASCSRRSGPPSARPTRAPASSPTRARARGRWPLSSRSEHPGSLLDVVPVLPVVVLERREDAVPVARALVAGGLPAIELTLRTPAALDAIRAISDEVPEILVGAGTVVTPGQAKEAVAAGPRFLVPPGSTPSSVAAMGDTGRPFLPGSSSVSEVLALLEHGLPELKFSPAEASGGTAYLRALAAPVPAARFCPTGGITPASAP